MPDWIKRSDYALRTQSANFSNVINQDPFAYGTTPLAAAQLATLQIAFADALTPTLQVTGNSTSAVRFKNEQRAILVERMREMGRVIRALPNMQPTDFERLSMNVPEGRRTRVPSPIDTPRISVGSPRARIVPLRVRSTLTPDTRGLPRDVTGIQVFIYAGEEPVPVSLHGWRQAGTFTTSNFDLDLNCAEIQSGQTVWIVAQYVNAKAEYGSLSSPVHTHALGPAMRIQNYVRIPGQAA